MKEAMKKWLERRQITFDPNTANSICNRFELDGEKADECLGLCYQLESDKITQAEFTGGLCVLTGKEPKEVMGVLKGMGSGSVKPWESEKFLIGQWHRSLILKPGVSITCKCGYSIPVPPKELSPERRYKVIYEEMEKHRPDCPYWKRLIGKEQ